MPANPSDSRPLAAEAVVVRLGRGQKEALISILERIEKDTVQEPVEAVQQLALTPELVTLYGKRVLTWLAVFQVCRAVCPGLSNVVADLSGRRGRRNTSSGYYDTAAAGQAYNAAVRLRFEASLFGRQMVRSVSANQVEAVVGPGYRRLANRDFLDHVTDVVRAGPGEGTLIEATLIGRRMTLRYTFPRTTTDDITTGVSFVNSEVGDTAIRASLFWEFPSGVAMMPVGPQDWVRHSGKDFYSKLARLLSQKVSQVSPVVSTNLGMTLGFTGDRDRDSDLGHRIARRLTASRLSIDHAVRAVKRCLGLRGDDDEPRRHTDLRGNPRLVSRDLVEALLVEGGQYDPGPTRQAYEHAAGGIISNPRFLKE